MLNENRVDFETEQALVDDDTLEQDEQADEAADENVEAVVEVVDDISSRSSDAFTSQEGQDDEETRQLLKKYQETHSVDIRNKIVLKHIPVAKKVAYQMRGICSDYAQVEDIINQGVISLIECVDRFDLNKQVKFSTYAYMRIKGSIIDYIRKQDWVPRRIRMTAKKINATHDALCSELMREPTNEEMAQRLGTDVETLNRYYSEIFGATTLSLESTINGIYLSDLDGLEESSADYAQSADNLLDKKELKKVITDAINSLSERERQIVSLYYYEELKQNEICDVLQISKQRVSQIMAKALEKIQYRVKKYMQEDL